MNWKNDDNQKLINAFLALENIGEAQAFLRDLMTEDEIKEFANRLKTAQMLSEKIPYSTIIKTTGLSSTTVARVSKWLNGPSGGYKTILNRLHHRNQSSREEIGGV
ncbi:MAG: YerC/YecD family TrpR-related protein [Candidatus Paceibacterota bacterium]